MKKVLKKFNRTLSIMLAVAMVLTMVPQTTLPVLAAAEDTELDNNEVPAVEDDKSDDADEAIVGETITSPENEQISEEGGETEGSDESNETPVTDSDQNDNEDPVDADNDNSTDVDDEDPVEEPAEEEIVEPTITDSEEPSEEVPAVTEAGALTVTFKDDSGFSSDTSIPYDGKEHKPTADNLTVKSGEGDSATDVTEYTITYSRAQDGDNADDTETEMTDFTSVGTITVTVSTGEGDSAQSGSITYTIAPADISTENAGYAITGVEESYEVGTLTEAPAVKVVKGEGEEAPALTADTDYTLKFTNKADNSEISDFTSLAADTTVVVTVTGTGNYTGTLTVEFTIVAAEVEKIELTGENCVVTLDSAENLKYTGSEITPAVSKVTYNKSDSESVELTADTDYTVAYEDNIKVGTAKVVITGTGDYSGSVEKTFTIAKAEAPESVSATIYADQEVTGQQTENLSDLALFVAGEFAFKPSKYAISTDNDAVVSGDVLDESNTPSVTEAGELTYTLKSSISNIETKGTIKVVVEFDNYENSTLILTVDAVTKTALYFKGDADSQVYTGAEIDYDVNKITQIVGGTGEDKDNEVSEEDNVLAEVKDYFVFSYTKENATASPVDAGTYDVTMSLLNNAKYKLGDDTFKATLTITPKEVKITASDKNWIIGSEKPSTVAAASDYVVEGLVDDETLTTEPTTLAYYHKTENGEKGAAVTDSEWETFEAGTELIIEVSGAVATANYTIAYESGTLTVRPEAGAPIYTYQVTLHNYGRTTDKVIEVPVGSLIDWDEIEPAEQEGYTFESWYKDEACTKVWNFATDTVQGDTDLYGVWLTKVVEGDEKGAVLQIRDIPDQGYTGNKIQPTVQVYNAAGTLLKKGKDYTITYKNNIDADSTDKENKDGGYKGRLDDENHGFNEDLPHVIITGKGNYAGTKTEPNVIYKNFHIKKAVIGNGSALTPGFTMKYTNQFVVSKKDLKPFTSLKYKKAMTLGKDYSVTIKGAEGSVKEKDASGAEKNVAGGYEAKNADKKAPVITKGYYGDFTLVVEGMNVNYEGKVEIPVIVAGEANQLLKNAKITLGKDVKTVNFSDYINAETGATEVILPVADFDGTAYHAVVDGAETETVLTDAKKFFTVSIGKGKDIKYLKAGSSKDAEGKDVPADYTISYSQNDAVGKATLTITANAGSGYVGSQSTTFTIKGTAFKNGKKGTVKVEGLAESYAYTGKPVTPNDTIKVSTTATPSKEFVFGADYTVKYANNLKKGKATVTFTANPKSGYTGSFKETFKIGVLNLQDEKDVNLYISGTLIGGENLSEAVATRKEAANKKSVEVDWKTAVAYAVAGSEINYWLRDTNNNILRAGTDFTAKYSNNKAVTTSATKRQPTLTITGKGNYTGKLVITFPIQNSNSESLKATGAPVQYNAKKAATFAYKPAITVKNGDGKNEKKVNAKEYTLTYERNTQADVEKYIKALEEGSADAESLRPAAVITLKETSSFYTKKAEAPAPNAEEGDTTVDSSNTIRVPLEIYKTKLTAKNCTITLTKNASQYRYTGSQVRPAIVSVIVKDGSNEVKLGAGDYTRAYGANIAAGKNKGTVTVTGKGLYGGSVTVKFNIDTSYIYQPAPTEKKTLNASDFVVTLKMNGEELKKDDNGKYSAVSDGSPVRPVVEVAPKGTDGTPGTPLVQNDDYVVAYGENNTTGENAGTVIISAASGSDSYTGSFTVTFAITEAPASDNKDLSKCTVTLYQPGTTDFTDDTKKLTERTDKTVADYDITVASVDSAVTPAVVVKNGDTTLVQDTDYTVAYADNDKASAAATEEGGEATVATVTIEAKEGSDYTGKQVIKFWITVGEVEPPAEKTDLSQYTVTVTKTDDSSTITKSDDGAYPFEVTTKPEGTNALTGVSIAVNKDNDTTLTAETDYTIAWSYAFEENAASGTGTATITGTGDYTGTIEVKFAITVKTEETE